MRERPILFSAPMVRAILEGRKTVTRRVVKPGPPDGLGMYACLGAWRYEGVDYRANEVETCPYGVPGDRLWVRETWYCDHFEVQRGLGGFKEVPGARDLLYYRARDMAPNGQCYTGFSGETMRCPWNPAIHMPRWASRITLEITGVRVERLQDISSDDASAEGVEWDAMGWTDYEHPERRKSSSAQSFETLWRSINGPGSWAANPWVWCVSFRHIEAARAAA